MGYALDVWLMRGPLPTVRGNLWLGVLGLSVLYPLGLAVDHAVWTWCGGGAAVAGTSALALTAWKGHSARSVIVKDALVDLWSSLGIFKRAAAIDLGIPPEQLSAQLSGREHFSLWRLTNMSNEVLVGLGVRLIALFGEGRYVVIECGPLSELVTSVKTQSSLLSMALGMSPSETDKEGAA